MCNPHSHTPPLPLLWPEPAPTRRTPAATPATRPPPAAAEYGKKEYHTIALVIADKNTAVQDVLVVYVDGATRLVEKKMATDNSFDTSTDTLLRSKTVFHAAAADSPRLHTLINLCANLGDNSSVRHAVDSFRRRLALASKVHLDCLPQVKKRSRPDKDECARSLASSLETTAPTVPAAPTVTSVLTDFCDVHEADKNARFRWIAAKVKPIAGTMDAWRILGTLVTPLPLKSVDLVTKIDENILLKMETFASGPLVKLVLPDEAKIRSSFVYATHREDGEIETLLILSAYRCAAAGRIVVSIDLLGSTSTNHDASAVVDELKALMSKRNGRGALVLQAVKNAKKWWTARVPNGGAKASAIVAYLHEVDPTYLIFDDPGVSDSACFF